MKESAVNSENEELSEVERTASADEATPAPTKPSRPAEIPEKFWDPEAGTVRVDALLRSYLELERKLGRSLPQPEGPDDAAARERLLAALGRPARPEDYVIETRSELLAPDPDLNARLHAAGFTQSQVQLVYDLAAERLLPMVARLSEEAEVSRQVERLATHFGGHDRWREVAREIKTWARANLEPEVYEALASSYQGVLALHRMMRSSEPELLGRAEDTSGQLDEQTLDRMVRDPRYWRDRDPNFIARVTEGFKSLYGD
jgi:hypothetical protein